MIFFFFDYIDLSFDNSHNELQLDELPSNDDDKLLKQIQTIQAAYRNGIDQNIEDLMVNRAFARDSLRMRYDSYVYGLEFYDFLVRTRKQLQEDPGTVTAKLQGIQDKLNNRMNAVVIYAGSENGIALNRSLSDQFLASLNAEKIERAEYDLPVPEKKEALIFDSSVQYNMMNISYSALGMGACPYSGYPSPAESAKMHIWMPDILSGNRRSGRTGDKNEATSYRNRSDGSSAGSGIAAGCLRRDRRRKR